jgi:hypothetical protein
LAFIRIVLRLNCGGDIGSYWKGAANATAGIWGQKPGQNQCHANGLSVDKIGSPADVVSLLQLTSIVK